MTMGTKADMVIYDVEFFSAITETVQQSSEDIEASANGTIRMISNNQKGDFEKSSFFKNIDGLIRNRDPNSTGDADVKSLTQDELVAVKINRGVGPVRQSIDSFKKIGEDPSSMSFYVGAQMAPAVVLDMVNTGVLAITTAMSSVAGMVHDVVAGSADVKTLNPIHLNDAFRKLGDRQGRVRALVMHSKSFNDLVGNQILEKVTGLSDTAVYGATPGTLNRPVYVTDSPALVIEDGVSAGVHAYRVLGLTEDALIINESEERTVMALPKTGGDNLAIEIQADLSYTVGVKGFAYTSAASPDDTVLGNTANWAYRYSDIKNGPGVVLVVE